MARNFKSLQDKLGMLRIPVTLHEARTLQSALELAKRESHKPADVAAYATLIERLNVIVPQPKKKS